MTGSQMPITIVLAALVGGCSPGADIDRSGPWGEVDPNLADMLQGELEDARAEQDLPGLAMAIAFHEDHTLWVSATGSMNLDPQTDWLPTHSSRMGSVTKTFTAAIIFQLVEEGVLTLDDPLEQWVSGWWTGVTIEDLLGHSSGIVSYNYVGSFDTSVPWIPDELVQWAWDSDPTLRFEPGTDWEYSNTNYVLLGLIIEAATGETYADQLQIRLFDPLELDSMWLSGTGEELPDDLVHCYSEPPLEDTSDVDPSFGWAAGSLVSQPGDLARWNDALFFGEVISESSRTLMLTPRGLTGSDETPYGLGAFYESDDEYTNYGHTGGISGCQTYAYTLEDPPATVVVMANQLGTDLRAASSYGWAAVLGIDYP